MDGLLAVDKPVGPTSHDIVAQVRRVVREQRVGHTGTLDPLASGVLPLVIGRATRLARFLDSGDKEYEAAIRLGWATDTYDAGGRVIGDRHEGALPSPDAIDRALDPFRGRFLQLPPAFSAKKIDGKRSYRTARAHARRSGGTSVAAVPTPAAVAVETTALEISCVESDLVRLRIRCSTGFYVRSLAHDLGRELGVGAHLLELRRTATCGVTLRDCVPFDEICSPAGLARVKASLIPMSRMLQRFPSATLTAEGVRRAVNGRDLAADMITDRTETGSSATRHVRLLDPGGELIGIARHAAASGLLHPAVILV